MLLCFPRTQMRRSAATDSNCQRRFGKPSARSGPPAVSIRSGNCSSSYGSERLWASPTVSHTGDGRERGHRLQKKYTANGLVRRGCPKGQPVVRFGHTYSCMMVGFYEPRTTNHEPLFFHEPRVTRGDVFNLSLLPRSGI